MHENCTLFKNAKLIFHLLWFSRVKYKNTRKEEQEIWGKTVLCIKLNTIKSIMYLQNLKYSNTKEVQVVSSTYSSAFQMNIRYSYIYFIYAYTCISANVQICIKNHQWSVTSGILGGVRDWKFKKIQNLL